MTTEDYSAVLIDGSLPRSAQERVAMLLDYVSWLLNERSAGRVAPRLDVGEPMDRYLRFQAEYREHQAEETPRPPLVHPENEWEFWHELEDDVVGLINDLLPEPWFCGVGINESPGDVIVTTEDELGEL